jgi:hypothetical protein
MKQVFRPLIHANVSSCCLLQLGQIYVDLNRFLPVHISPSFPCLILTALSDTQDIHQGSPTFSRKRVTAVIVDWFAGPAWKNENKCAPNCLNYCEIFIACAQFTNVNAGCIIQPGGKRVGDP